MFITTFVVSASKYSHFPLDMLRYDRCFPESQDDVNHIEDSLQRRNDAPEQQHIRLIHYHQYKTVVGLTPARWSSFGWSCQVIRTEKL